MKANKRTAVPKIVVLFVIAISLHQKLIQKNKEMTKFNVARIGIILMLMVTSLGFISCNDDDDNYTDPAIGTWNLVSMNGKEVSECVQKSEVSILANGNYSVVNYAEGSDGTCAVKNTANGVWENKGNSVYSIQIDGHSERESKIVFSNNNNTMTSTFIRVDGETTTTETSVMKRK